MFEIKFRIVEQFQELKEISADVFDKEWGQITGYFNICFGQHVEGAYYHENILADWETGDELVDYWLMRLLDAFIFLKNNGNYFAFSEIETINTWIEFKKIENNILINVAIDDNNENNKLYITDYYNFSYTPPCDYVVSEEEFRDKLIDSTTRFLQELKDINENLTETKMYLYLNDRLNIIKDMRP